MNIGCYVSMKDGQRTALLLGPYSEHSTPLNRKAEAQRVACEINPWYDFCAFGTCKIETPNALPLGSLNKRQLMPLSINSLSCP